MDIGLVSVGCVPVIWGDVQELIEEKGQEWLKIVDLKEIYQRCLEDQLDLWIGNEKTELKLVMFCGWERHAKRSYYHVIWIGGRDIKGCLKEGIQKIEHYACLSGGNEVRLGGRGGWERLLKPYGYSSRSVELRKDVTVCWRH